MADRRSAGAARRLLPPSVRASRDASRAYPPTTRVPIGRTGSGRQFAFEFPAAVADAARALAVREQASLYSVLLAAFAAALGRYADRRTVVIGAPVTRRTDPATQLILGPFMNTVPLRIDLDAARTCPRWSVR